MKSIKNAPHILIISFLLFLLITPVMAEDLVITEDDLFAEIDTVSGVTHMRQTLQQVPASVTIIDRQMIEASAALDVVDLFRLVPGFHVYFNHANKPGVTYHAFGTEFPRRIEVKVDGRSVYESFFSSVEWNTLGVSLDDIDHIEVVRGSNVPADGSNAFLASVNIVTRSSLLDDGLSVSTQLGNQGIRNSSVTYGGKIGEFDQRITLQSRRNDGFEDFIGVHAGKQKAIAIDDGAKTKTLRYKALWTPSTSDSLEIQMGMGDTITANTPEDYYRRQFDYSYQHLQWNHINSDWNDISFVLYHNSLNFEDQAEEIKFLDAYGMIYAKDREFLVDGDTGTSVREGFFQSLEALEQTQKDSLFEQLGLGAYDIPSFDDALNRVSGGLQPAFCEDWSDFSTCSITQLEWGLVNALPNNTIRASKYQNFSDRWDAELRGNFYKWDNLRIGLGVAARHDSASSEIFLGSQKVSQVAYRSYANFEWLFSEDVTVNAGFVTERIEQSGSNNSYRAAANYQLSDQQTIRLAVNHSYRAPSLLERFYKTDYKYNENITLDVSVSFDPNIAAEQLSSYELGYSGSFLDRSLLFDVRIFDEDFSGIINHTRLSTVGMPISYDYNQQVNIYTNTDDLQLRGIEWQLQYRPTSNIIYHVNHSYIDAEGTSLYRNTPYKEILSINDTTPTNILTASGSYVTRNKLRLSVMYHFKSGYRSILREQHPDAKSKSYSRIDLMAAKKWQFANHWAELSFIAQNIGSDYTEHHYLNQFSSKYIVGLKFGPR